MPAALRILFDGECPFCKRKVTWLQRLDRHKNLNFEDIAATE
ncbi:MAG: DCC1-like thiol-disulfide oxidoreductase family protein, partial [Planctomycetota bacterium]|nr:DCC1-like thiol-disulfide oxidoreductase family protein [Planctomycetota bacterium]